MTKQRPAMAGKVFSYKRSIPKEHADVTHMDVKSMITFSVPLYFDEGLHQVACVSAAVSVPK